MSSLDCQFLEDKEIPSLELYHQDHCSIQLSTYVCGMNAVSVLGATIPLT